MSSAAFSEKKDWAYPHKSAEAFRTISEVAIALDVPQHVLRFWESRFAQVRPVKRAGGRRYYRPEDIDLLKGIRALLYGDGFTIKGVQKVLKERGHRHVASVGRGQEPERPLPQVIEKIVYVERPVSAPAKKLRPTHLRAVTHTLDLPFFDSPPYAAPEPEAVAAAIARVAVAMDAVPEAEALQAMYLDDVLAAQDREWLEELLDELSGLKTRLQTAREVIQK